MSMAVQLTEFLEQLASRSATPGGGSASALVGSVAGALCGMVARLNDKKDGTPGVLHDTIAEADALRGRLLSLMDEDIAAFNALAASWKLPDDEAHAAERQAAVIEATRTPLSIMQASLEVMRLAARGLARSKKNCLSDAGVAALFAHAALEGARLNVLINLPGIRDERTREELTRNAESVRGEAHRLRGEIETRLAENYGG
ncbi:MAG: formiminotransferase-cyclodeaminase [Planctomycetota bacterium]|nr:MAG: formiminotransferase-cyclodeaminase [Planctomycetota bacterium]